MYKHFCGYDGYEAFDNLYFTQTYGTPSDILNSGVCVKECPQKDANFIYKNI